jgi:hypothetical protein
MLWLRTLLAGETCASTKSVCSADPTVQVAGGEHMSRLLVRGGTVLDEERGLGRAADVLISTAGSPSAGLDGTGAQVL